MIDEVQKLLDDYMHWLRDKTTLREVNGHIEITTPYLDRHNDYVQIYARKQNGGYVLTDDSFTIEDLRQTGCKLESEKRQKLLTVTLNGFGVHRNGDALEIHASPEDFALRKHNLVQAVLAVNDMFYLAEPMVASVFHEDVANWLDMHDVRWTPNIKLTGKSGLDHLFEFVIPKSRRQPERILKAINRPRRDSAQAMAFAWLDTREVRSVESKAYAIINDFEKPLSESVSEALRNYDVRPVAWSKREDVIEELAA